MSRKVPDRADVAFVVSGLMGTACGLLESGERVIPVIAMKRRNRDEADLTGVPGDPDEFCAYLREEGHLCEWVALVAEVWLTGFEAGEFESMGEGVAVHWSVGDDHGWWARPFFRTESSVTWLDDVSQTLPSPLVDRLAELTRSG